MMTSRHASRKIASQYLLLTGKEETKLGALKDRVQIHYDTRSTSLERKAAEADDRASWHDVFGSFDVVAACTSTVLSMSDN